MKNYAICTILVGLWLLGLVIVFNLPDASTVKETQNVEQAKETIRNSEYFEIKIKDEVIIRLQEDGKFFVEGKEVATDKELFEGFKRAILQECK